MIDEVKKILTTVKGLTTKLENKIRKHLGDDIYVEIDSINFEGLVIRITDIKTKKKCWIPYHVNTPIMVYCYTNYPPEYCYGFSDALRYIKKFFK